jgi:hypothetical protein
VIKAEVHPASNNDSVAILGYDHLELINIFNGWKPTVLLQIQQESDKCWIRDQSI